MLFDPAEHEPLADTPWSEARVSDAVAAIVAEAERSVDERGAWPAHVGDDAPTGAATLYFGSAGMIWALQALGSQIDLGTVAERALARYRVEPDFEQGDVPSLWMGESGILVVAERVGAVAADADRLLARVRENAQNETWELMWGSPGTMLAARALHEWTGEERWAVAWRESAERLWEEWGDDDLWTQHLYGRVAKVLGPPHGLAGNVHALRPLGRDDELRARVARALEETVLREGELANWPPAKDGSEPPFRVQWCHGAPGIVATLGDLVPTELALAGGELTWRAGPLVKGPGLCHGTAGNGYALLRLFALTGDELWLKRARQFAVHALEHVERERAKHGRGRFTLWTGDIGVALYARACIERDARVPTVDFW